MYSGTNGFYAQASVPVASITPFKSTFERILKTEMPLNQESDIGLHCTIMYSQAALRVSPQRALATNLPMQKAFFEARVVGIDWWEGHDKEGYLVAKLVSSQLQARHKVWQMLGAVPTFSPYSPHITLLKGPASYQFANQVESFNLALKAIGTEPVILRGETINDLK